RIFAVLLAAWVLAGVSMAVWLCYSRHASYESERWQHLDTWCYERAKLFEQHTLTTVSHIHTFAGLASVMGRPRAHGQWAWDKCFTQQRWDEYINKTGYARPGNTGGALCPFVTDKERPAFEKQYGGPIVDMAGQPQQRQPLYCPKLLDINYYRGSIPLMDLVQRLPEELHLVKRTGEVVFGAVVPIGNLSFNLTGVRHEAGEEVMGAAGSVVDLVSIIQNVLENVFSPALFNSVVDLVSIIRNVLENVFSLDPSITFEAYDTTDPSAPTVIYGPGPRLLFYKERDIAPFTAASPANATRPWEQRAVVPLDLLGGRLRQYHVWCRYTQPTNAWQSWGVPFLWTMLSLVLTALVAAVAWQQRMGFQRNQDGLAKADVVRESALAVERSKSQFVASMSRELRTPMIGIMGLLDALADMGLSGAQLVDVGAARVSAQDTVRLVNRVLDLSKLEAPCCVVGVVDMKVPLELEMDAMRLTQALQELVDNALHHTTEGHVLLRVAVCPASTPLQDALHQLDASDAPIQPCPPPSPSFFARATHFATILTARFTQTLLKPWTKADVARQSAATEGRAIVGAAEKTAGETPREGEQVREGLGGEGGSEGSRDGNGWSRDGEEEGVQMKCGNAIDSLTGGGECMQLVVSCEDTGCGFDASLQQYLFQFKVSSKQAESVPGQPLGEEGANGGEDGENGGEEGEEDKIWPEDMWGCGAISRHRNRLNRNSSSRSKGGVRHLTAEGGGQREGRKGEREEGMGCVLGLEGVTVGVMGSDVYRQEPSISLSLHPLPSLPHQLTARILSTLCAQAHLLPPPAAEASGTVLSHVGGSVGSSHRESNRDASGEESFLSPCFLNTSHVGDMVGSSGRESGEESSGRRLLSSPCHSQATSHVEGVVKIGTGDSGGWAARWFGGKRGREGGESRDGREEKEVRESRRWVVVVEEEDVWRVQCEGEAEVACNGAWRRVGGEVVCKGAGGGSREAGGWHTGVQTWCKRVPVVALVPADAAVWQAGVRVVRGLEGMARGALVVGVVVVMDCCGEEAMGDGREGVEEEEEEEVEEEEKWEKSAEEEERREEERRDVQDTESGESGSIKKHRAPFCALATAVASSNHPASSTVSPGSATSAASASATSAAPDVSTFSAASAAASGVSTAISPRVVICRPPLLPHHLHHAVQLAAFGRNHFAGGKSRPDDPEQGGREESDIVAPQGKPVLESTQKEAGPADTEQGGREESAIEAPQGKERGVHGDWEAKEKGTEVLGTSLGAGCSRCTGRTVPGDDSSSGSNSASSRRGDMAVEDTGTLETAPAAESAAAAAAAAAAAESSTAAAAVTRLGAVTAMRSLSASAASPATATQSARELQRRGGSLPSKGGTAVLQGVGVQAGTGLNAVQQGAGVLGGVHVLVVDNAAVNLLVARRTLTRSGATVATAASGEEALRQVKLALEGTVHPMEPALGGSAQPADGHVDVVLMDLQMPLMDGQWIGCGAHGPADAPHVDVNATLTTLPACHVCPVAYFSSPESTQKSPCVPSGMLLLSFNALALSIAAPPATSM
ncbi:unnamed protein product, partial [Closterium sp. Naga37s-1]